MVSRVGSLHSAPPSLFCLRPVFWVPTPPNPPVSEPETSLMAPDPPYAWGGWCPAERAPDSPQITLTKGVDLGKESLHCPLSPLPLASVPVVAWGLRVERDGLPAPCSGLGPSPGVVRIVGSQMERTERWEWDPAQ